jgi:delta14-sterol reductase
MIAPVLLPIAVFALVLALHRLLPSRHVEGYARDEHDRPLPYRLNGLVVFLVVIGLWALACAQGLIAWDALWVHRWDGLEAACVLGIICSALSLGGAAPRCGLLADFYLGRRMNPRALGIDAKMYLYLAGATLLELNLLSFAAAHLRAHPGSHAPLLHVGLFSFFLVDYLAFERVHLYTYDLVAERLGFKLVWGCLVFYPYFYAVGLWSVVTAPDPHAPVWLEALAIASFFIGWALSRGANLQKYLFKARPGARLLGVVPQRALEDESGRRVLVSGFWGVSRHVNYLGEILMAIGLALALGQPAAIGPWLYPLYYVALLLPRERDDDRRCAGKYGALWERYRKEVRWRIVPGVY